MSLVLSASSRSGLCRRKLEAKANKLEFCPLFSTVFSESCACSVSASVSVSLPENLERLSVSSPLSLFRRPLFFPVIFTLQ